MQTLPRFNTEMTLIANFSALELLEMLEFAQDQLRSWPRGKQAILAPRNQLEHDFPLSDFFCLIFFILCGQRLWDENFVSILLRFNFIYAVESQDMEGKTRQSWR